MARGGREVTLDTNFRRLADVLEAIWKRRPALFEFYSRELISNALLRDRYAVCCELDVI